MGKASRKKRDPGRVRREGIQHSPLAQLSRQGSVLQSPLMAMGKTTLVSWRDKHAPEMLWAFLLATAIPRADYLDCFRRIATWAAGTLNRDEASSGEPLHQPAVIPDQTRLGEASSDELAALAEIIAVHPSGLRALRPLLLFEDLPGRDQWRAILVGEPDNDDWNAVSTAAIGMMDHQSEVSTDIRWLKLLTVILAGKMHYPETFREKIEEIFAFPNQGDMRSVRPFIRSGEMAIRRGTEQPWVKAFWDHCFRATLCVDPTSAEQAAKGEIGAAPSISISAIINARLALAGLTHELATTTAIDARLEGASGLCLYGLALLTELAYCKSESLISGRLILRSLTEAFITLKYLSVKDNPDLWKSWRVYGNGQAKLAFLKAEEHADDLPSFVNLDQLEALCNEDVWMEFEPINVGHWDKSNLREMSAAAGVKDVWEKYYQWPSAYVHGQWSATRDVNFITCHNPLHRLHRIPRIIHRQGDSVAADAVSLTNQMLECFCSLTGVESGAIPSVDLLAAASNEKGLDSSR